MTTNNGVVSTTTQSIDPEAKLKMKLEALIKNFPVITIEDALKDVDLIAMAKLAIEEERQLEVAKAKNVLKQQLSTDKLKLEKKIETVASKPTDPESMKKWIKVRQQERARGVSLPTPLILDKDFVATLMGVMIVLVGKLSSFRKVFPDTTDNGKKIDHLYPRLLSHVQAAQVVLQEFHGVENIKSYKGKYSFREVTEKKLFEYDAEYTDLRKFITDSQSLADSLASEVKEKFTVQPANKEAKVGAPLAAPAVGEMKFGEALPPVQHPRRRSGKKDRSQKTPVASPATPEDGESVGQPANEVGQQ